MAVIKIHEEPGMEEATLHGIELPNGTTLWEEAPGCGYVAVESPLNVHSSGRVFLPSSRGYTPRATGGWERWLEGYAARLADLGATTLDTPRLVSRRVTLIVSGTEYADAVGGAA